MAYYYLVSQLPNISTTEGKANLPLNGKSFIELAGRFISEDEKITLNGLSLVPPKELTSTGSVFLDTWYEKERNLRFALAQIRAQKMKKDSIPLPPGCTADIVNIARTAVGMDSPLSAEQFLFEYRIKLLDEIRPMDNFSIDAVYAYGLKLMLVERMRKFDVENGKASYHEIYDNILGDK
ncbi:MAG: DUF2764 domain-containing protein [Spirochaetia bacterium]|nr:DUF2764 domain-containing protein [Spirochaetia bacterium]MDD7269698.1 DUF2764 family protein [Treponema sp.]MDY4985604.1 DUF2764 family protein [Treponema sp.]